MGDFKVTGVERVLKSVQKKRREDAVSIAEGGQKAGEIGLKKALYYCPIEKGPLRASGRVETEGKGRGAETRIEFGGPEAPYALWVHQDLDAKHDPPTCALFLERAVRETRGAMTKAYQGQFEARPVKTIDAEEVK
jgi:hypothetical protein